MAGPFDPAIGKATQFNPGQSGNPGGRPGYRVRAERLLEKQATDKDVRAVLATIIDRAKEGEPWACEMPLKRLLPTTERREVETGGGRAA